VQSVLEDNTCANVKMATSLDHLNISHVPTESPRGRFHYYYPNTAHWLSQSFSEPPMASSTPPQSPIGRCRSVSLNIPMDKSTSEPDSFSFPPCTNLSRRPLIKIPPPSFCDTSVPPPSPSLIDFPYDVAFQAGKSRLGSYLCEEDSIGWLEPSSPMRCWQVV